MKNLFKKDINLFFSDKKTIFLTFVLPVILVSIFTLAFSGLRTDKKGVQKIEAIKIAVVDQDVSMASQAVLSELKNESILSIATIDSTNAYSYLKKGKLMGVLHIKKGFMESYTSKEELKWSFSYLAGSEFQINVFKSFFTPMLKKIGNKYSNQPEDCGNNFGLAFNSINVNKSKKQAYNDPWLIQPIIGIAIILLLFNVINIGGNFIDEYNNKTLNRLLISPANYSSFIFSKSLLYFLVCSIQFALILLFASYFLGLRLFNIPAIVLLVIVGSLACTAFCLFITSISKTRNQLNSLSIAGILFLSAIGGSMMPSFIMPAAMQKLSQFSINYWVIESFFDVLWRRVGIESIINNVAILLLITAVLLAFSSIIFRRRFSKL